MSISGSFALRCPHRIPCIAQLYSCSLRRLLEGMEPPPQGREFYHTDGFPQPDLYKETFGSPKFPGYPFRYMPWSQTPMVSCVFAIAHTGLLPSATCRASAFSRISRIILMTTTMHISGLNTQPVSSIHPASDSRLRVCPWISLLTRWLSFSQVGFPCNPPEAPTG